MAKRSFRGTGYLHVGYEVLTAVITNVIVFWDISPCSPYVNRRFGGTYHLHLQGRKSAEQETSVYQRARQYASQPVYQFTYGLHGATYVSPFWLIRLS
jgi:hypothetical protein